MAVRMELARVLIRENSSVHVVELREVDGGRIFPIIIGITEAAAIERRLMGQQPPRPQTHELMVTILDALGASIKRIVINDLKNQTFFARIFLEQAGRSFEIDCRPSDALALGVSSDVEIYVEEHVLDEVCRLE